MSSELFIFDNFPMEIFQGIEGSNDYETSCNINQIESGFQVQNLVKTETTQNLMQRSYSSNSFDRCHHSQFLRRVCSTGDLHQQNMKFATITEESHFKVGRYSAQERKERIDRYRAKRTLRNFNKTIKYACRKTLADTRPRVRGRFARNDEMPKQAAMFHEDDHLWIYGLLEEDDDRSAQNGAFFDVSNSALQKASYSTFYV